MKKVLFFLFIFLALKQQAQSLCDYTYTIGNQSQFEVVIPTTGNGIINAVPLYALTTVGTNTFEDSCFCGPCTHTINNIILQDTITTCISYIENGVDTFICCFEQYWDGQLWQRQMMCQTWFSCDSITYTANQGNLMFEVSLGNYNPVADSLEIFWSVCNTTSCYNGQGQFNAFPQILITDTIKVCYDAHYYYTDTTVSCYHCDSMIYSQIEGDWILYGTQNNNVGVEDIVVDRLYNNKIYDILGIELSEIPIGRIYIKNRKIFFKSNKW